MALSVAAQRRDYPLPVYNFRVNIGGDQDLGVSEVAGLAREHQTLTYRQGFSAWEGEGIVKFRIDRHAPVTLKKALVPGKTARWLYAWLDSSTAHPVTISLCDLAGGAANARPEARITWHLRQALLVRIEAPPLQAQANEVAIETLTLMASGFRIEHH